MIKWLKDNLINILIGCVLGIPFGMYAVSQQQPPQNTEVIEEHRFICVTEVAVTVVEDKEEKQTYFDVPLSHELQDFIFQECEKKNIAPSLIIAIIERESNYNSAVIGDNGKSIGLMQIQPKWHTGRMDKLGVKDLLNPFENVMVGIDLISELKSENSDLFYVLMAYNGGSCYADKHFENGDISEYAIAVSERAYELEGV